MIAKRFANMAAILVVSSLLGAAAVPNAIAQPLHEIAAEGIFNKEDVQDEPARQGLPGRRIGGGTRSDGIFLYEGESLAALTVPESLTVTTSAYPKMLFHVPEMRADNSAEFVLLDAAGEVVYEKAFVAERAAALVSIDTASIKGAVPIHLNKDYEWYFSLIPDATDRANDIVVHGSIRRVDVDEWLSQQSMDAHIGDRLATADPLSQAQILYKEANLWHDAAVVLSELRQAKPGDEVIAAAWTQLLAAADLRSIVE